MSPEIWFIYLGTVLLFMSTPGISHLLMLSNSISCGFHRSLATAGGDLTANFFQMLAASIGLVGVLHEFQEYFSWVKWAGVAYLVWLGINLLVSKDTPARSKEGTQRSLKSLYWQGFFTSAANPKAVIFFAALFPQFIVASDPLLPQFLVMCASYLIIDGIFLCGYGKFADFIATKLDSLIGRHFNKIAGTLLIGVAVLLGLKDIEKP